jgi:putative sterol carrier protein
LVDIAESEADAAQIRLEMSSDDLLALVDGRLNLATAWATGRVRVHAGVRDLIRLRSLF